MKKDRMKKLGAFAIAAMMAATAAPAMTAPSFAAGEDNAEPVAAEQGMACDEPAGEAVDSEEPENPEEEIQAPAPETPDAEADAEEPAEEAFTTEAESEGSAGLRAVDQNKERYEKYLNGDKRYYTEYADYDLLRIDGFVPDLEYYNEEVPSSLQIKESEVFKIKVTAKVGDKTYTGKIQYSDYMMEPYCYEIKFQKAALGTPVTVTYQMGTCTRTEKLVVSRYIDFPKHTIKNYVYDGKMHTGKMTIKIGGQTLKEGRDYYLETRKRKSVGWEFVEAYNTRTSKYRFEIEDGKYRIYPRGTSIKKYKRGKKSFTVTWKRQDKKMAKTRITGYQIQYSTSKKFTKKTTKTLTVKGYKNTSRKITRLKKKTKYYVRVRTYKYADDMKLYSKWSKGRVVKTK